MPLTIYSSDGQVIGVYGEQRREFDQNRRLPKIFERRRDCRRRQTLLRSLGRRRFGAWRAAIGNVMAAAFNPVPVRLRNRLLKLLPEQRAFVHPKIQRSPVGPQNRAVFEQRQDFGAVISTKSIWVNALWFRICSPNLFQQNVNELTLAEAAMLAGFAQSPFRLQSDCKPT